MKTKIKAVKKLQTDLCRHFILTNNNMCSTHGKEILKNHVTMIRSTTGDGVVNKSSENENLILHEVNVKSPETAPLIFDIQKKDGNSGVSNVDNGTVLGQPQVDLPGENQLSEIFQFVLEHMDSNMERFVTDAVSQSSVQDVQSFCEMRNGNGPLQTNCCLINDDDGCGVNYQEDVCFAFCQCEQLHSEPPMENTPFYNQSMIGERYYNAQLIPESVNPFLYTPPVIHEKPTVLKYALDTSVALDPCIEEDVPLVVLIADSACLPILPDNHGESIQESLCTFNEVTKNLSDKSMQRDHNLTKCHVELENVFTDRILKALSNTGSSDRLEDALCNDGVGNCSSKITSPVKDVNKKSDIKEAFITKEKVKRKCSDTEDAPKHKIKKGSSTQQLNTVESVEIQVPHPRADNTDLLDISLDILSDFNLDESALFAEYLGNSDVTNFNNFVDFEFDKQLHLQNPSLTDTSLIKETSLIDASSSLHNLL